MYTYAMIIPLLAAAIQRANDIFYGIDAARGRERCLTADNNKYMQSSSASDVDELGVYAIIYIERTNTIAAHLSTLHFFFYFEIHIIYKLQMPRIILPLVKSQPPLLPPRVGAFSRLYTLSDPLLANFVGNCKVDSLPPGLYIYIVFSAGFFFFAADRPLTTTRASLS